MLRAITKLLRMRDKSVVRFSVTPSAKYSWLGSLERFLKGKTTIERRGGADFSGPGVGAGLRRGGRADFKRIDPDRLGDVLELGQAEVAHLQIESAFDLAVSVLGKTYRSRLANTLHPRRDIDAIAHQVAIVFLDHIAEMNADPKFDAAVGRDTRVALDHRSLDFNGAALRRRHSELDDWPSPVRLTMRP